MRRQIVHRGRRYAATRLSRTLFRTTNSCHDAAEYNGLSLRLPSAWPVPVPSRKLHADVLCVQAFQYGWPLIYFAKFIWQRTMNPKSVQRPLNSWISTRHFAATSFY